MTLRSLIDLDARLSQQMRVAEEPGPLHNLAAFLGHSGDSWFWLAALPLFWWLGDDYWRWRAQVLVISILVTAITVLALKFTFRRRRPEGDWGQIYRATDPHSFPSGHAARAFLIGVVMLGLGPPWLGVPLMVWAPLVGLARVSLGVHYLSDILVGFLLGAGMGLGTLWVVG